MLAMKEGLDSIKGAYAQLQSGSSEESAESE